MLGRLIKRNKKILLSYEDIIYYITYNNVETLLFIFTFFVRPKRTSSIQRHVASQIIVAFAYYFTQDAFCLIAIPNQLRTDQILRREQSELQLMFSNVPLCGIVAID